MQGKIAREANLTAAALRDTPRLVAGSVERELASEGLPSDTLGQLRSGELLLARTADRSVLGCMGDIAQACEHQVALHGGLERVDVRALNRLLHRNINSARGYEPPIKLAAARAGSAAPRG